MEPGETSASTARSRQPGRPPAGVMAALAGARLRELRGAARLTQQQLASRLGVSKAAVSAWERGLSRPGRAAAAALARALGVAPEALRPPAVGLPESLLTKARLLAVSRGVGVGEYLARALRGAVERDYRSLFD